MECQDCQHKFDPVEQRFYVSCPHDDLLCLVCKDSKYLCANCWLRKPVAVAA